jgi:hypothetical protein
MKDELLPPLFVRIISEPMFYTDPNDHPELGVEHGIKSTRIEGKH